MASICIQPAIALNATGLKAINRNGGRTAAASYLSEQRSHLPTLQISSPLFGSMDKLKFSNKQSSQKFQSLSVTVRAAVGTVVTEPATSIQFSSTIVAPGGSKELSLLGAGVREKKIVLVSVKVYAVGLYFENSFAGSLSEFKGKDLTSDPAFFKALAEAPVEKSVIIVLARDVDGETFWNALKESLSPRLASAGPEGEAALLKFGDVLKARNLKEKTGIFLTWKQPSTLEVGIAEDASTLKVPTETVASVESGALLSALFDVYLGADPVSPSAKLKVAETAKGLL